MNLLEFINIIGHFLKADSDIWQFDGFGSDERQEAWRELKGIPYIRLEVELLSHDLHSANACVLPPQHPPRQQSAFFDNGSE